MLIFVYYLGKWMKLSTDDVLVFARDGNSISLRALCLELLKQPQVHVIQWIES